MCRKLPRATRVASGRKKSLAGGGGLAKGNMRFSTTEATHSQRPVALVVDDSVEVAEVTSSLFERLGSTATRLKRRCDSWRKARTLIFSSATLSCRGRSTGLASRMKCNAVSEFASDPYDWVSDAAQAAPRDLRILRKPFDTESLRSFLQDTMESRLTSTN